MLLVTQNMSMLLLQDQTRAFSAQCNTRLSQCLLILKSSSLLWERVFPEQSQRVEFIILQMGKFWWKKVSFENRKATMNRIAGEVTPQSVAGICLVTALLRDKVRQWEPPVHFYSKEKPEDKANQCIRMLRAFKGAVIVAADSRCLAKWEICNSDHAVGSCVCCFR